VLTGDYATPGVSWMTTHLVPGQQLGEPAPLFRKLDPELAQVELARMAPPPD
jgi:methionyl-tRNA synthetase